MIRDKNIILKHITKLKYYCILMTYTRCSKNHVSMNPFMFRMKKNLKSKTWIFSRYNFFFRFINLHHDWLAINFSIFRLISPVSSFHFHTWHFLFFKDSLVNSLVKYLRSLSNYLTNILDLISLCNLSMKNWHTFVIQ